LTDLDSVERAKKELRQQAEALEGGDVTLTVIQFAEMAEKLASPRGQEQDPFAVYALGIQSALSNLQSDLRQVATKVDFLTNAELVERPLARPLLGTRSGKASYLDALDVLEVLGRGTSASQSSKSFLSRAMAAAQKEVAARAKTREVEPTPPPPDGAKHE
jgi:hypothetical protein